MIKRLGLAIASVTVVAAGVGIMGLGDQPVSASQQVQSQTPPPLCTMPTDRRYSAGAMVDRDGQIYQCMFVFGQNLAPAGVAWVKMEKQVVFTTKDAGK